VAGIPKDVFEAGAAYEPYVGRWSRVVAREFLAWLGVPADRRWADVGCGTGALSETILALANPREVVGIDRSEGFVAYAREHVRDPRIRFEVGDAQALPLEADAFDAVVSALMLNFVPDPASAVAEMARVARPGGTVALYVWDYAEGMRMMRHFWDAAIALDPANEEADESRRFPICQPGPLEALFRNTGLREVQARGIEIATPFRDFDDFWTPFLGGQGAAPAFAMALDAGQRDALRERVRSMLPIQADGAIGLTARAWAVRGTV
jgi:SAM-dependent methyltransferase